MSILSFNSLVCWQITLTLLHVSWIGLVIGLIAALANAVLRNSTANRRYWLNFASLLLFAASLPITFAIVRGVTAEVPAALNVAETPVSEVANLTLPIVEEPALVLPPTDAADFAPDSPQSLPSDPEVPAVVSLPTVTQPPPSGWERVTSIGHAAAPYVAVLYAFGVGLMFVKLAFGVRVSRKLRSASQPVTDATILARLAEQAKKLSLRITPVVAFCEHTAVPIVVGLLRPMILIPAAMVNGLTIEQLESVLTHELAHLRRRDHLMIVVQRVLEAILFFHPVTWYLSHHLHDDRETSCDDLVLSIGGDRLQYAQSLLRVAELRLASQSHQKHIALAADGQRPSKLRQRIARLLGDTEGDSVRVSSVWLLTILVGTFIAGIWTLTATSLPVAASIADEAIIQAEESRKLIYQALASVRSIKTAHVKFRIARPGIEFNKTLAPKYVRQVIEENDLVQNPDNLRRVLESFVSDAGEIVEQPWSNVDLYREGKRVRTTTSSANHGPDEFVEDEVLSLRWDAANWQMNITPIAKERDYQETLDQFLSPDDDLLNGANGSISMFRYLQRFRGEGSARSMTTDPQTGNVLEITIINPADEVKTEYLRLGWKKYDDQIWFPTVVAELNYENGNLSRCQFIIIEQAVFNKPLPAGIFQLGAPAGSVIVEKRNDADWARKINRDVFDVTSVEQVEAALEPLSKELTHDEENGEAEATRLYTLNEGTALKRIGPPFPLARKYVPRMLGDRQAHRPRELSRLISWNGTKFESYHSVDGGTFSARHLAFLLTGVGSPEIEGDKDLLEPLIPGDFVFREGATKEDLLRDLQEIVSNEATTPVKIEFRNVERTVYRATGELKLNLPEGRSEVAINGGPHNGDFGESISGGNANSLLRSVAAYIKTRIINEVTAPDDRFEWSERWYDLDSTKPENRFHLDAAVVLQQITEQTGIQFAEEKKIVPVLFIERATGNQPVAAGSVNGVNDPRLSSIAEQINQIGQAVLQKLDKETLDFLNNSQRKQLVLDMKLRLAEHVSVPLAAPDFETVLSAIGNSSKGPNRIRFAREDTFMTHFAVLEWRIWVGMDPLELTPEEFARREAQRAWFRAYIKAQPAPYEGRQIYLSKSGKPVELTFIEYDLLQYEELLSDPTYPFLFFPFGDEEFEALKASLKLTPSNGFASIRIYDEYEKAHRSKVEQRWHYSDDKVSAIWGDGTEFLKGFADDTVADADLPDAGPSGMASETKKQVLTPAKKIHTAPPKDALIKLLATNVDLNAARKNSAGLQYTTIGPIPDQEWEPVALEEAFDVVLTGMKENFERIKTWSGECQEVFVSRDNSVMNEKSHLVRFELDVSTSKGGAVQTASKDWSCPVAAFDTQELTVFDRLVLSEKATDAATQFHAEAIFYTPFFFGHQNELHWDHIASLLKYFEDTETPESERFVIAYRAKDRSSGMWRIDAVYGGIQAKLLDSWIISGPHGFNALRETRVLVWPDGKTFLCGEVFQSYSETAGVFVPSERLEREFERHTENLRSVHLQRITRSIVNQPLEPLPVLTPLPPTPQRVFPGDEEPFGA